MGIDFDVNVDIKTNGKDQIDTLEKQIENLKKLSTIKIDVDVVGKNGTDLSKLFNNIEKQAQASGKSVANNFQQGIKSVKFNGDTFYKQYFNQARKDIKEAERVQTDFSKSLSGLNTKGIDKNALKAVRAANKEISALQKQQEKTYNKNLEQTRSAENAQKRILAQQRIAEMKSQAIQKNAHANELVQQGKDNISKWSQQYDNQYRENQKAYFKQVEEYNKRELEYVQKRKEYETQGKKQAQEDADGRALVSAYKQASEYQQKESEYLKLRNQYLAEGKKQEQEYYSKQQKFSQLDATIASNKTLSWLKNNSKAAKDYGDILTDLAQKQRLATNSEDLRKYTKQVNAIKSEATALGKTGRSAFEEIGNSFKRIGQFVGTYGLIQQIPNKIGEMYQEVVKVDTAMTNLYKVTDETSAAYDKFLKGSGTTAKELGRDISSYITQTSEWAKLGYNMNSSSELAKISSIYSNVGEVDDKTAVSDLVTVMKAYNMQDTQAINIVDMLNQLGNQYATSAADLGTGLSKMASTMSMSGVSLEKSLAVLTGGVEITQDADALGNAIKVSVLRMRGQKGALEDLGEYADDVESVSKMQTQILNMTKGAVNIMDSADPTAFRDWYDVMEDVAEVLPKLQETDQANLIETLFGKNRANQGQAILQAFQSGQIQKAYQTALNSEGSAMKEQERWLDSIEAKQQKMSAAFQELSTTAINSDFVKGMIDTGTGAIEVITEIIDKVGILQTLIGGFAIGKGITSFVKSFDKPACMAS